MSDTKRARFYIGLHKPSDTTRPSSREIRRRRKVAKDILEDAFDGLTYYNATGVWKGSSEPTLVAEVFTDLGAAFLHYVAGSLAATLEQESVGVEITFDVVFNCVSGADTKGN